ncbi:hypothetical protein D172_003255 [Pseudoalteromonas sp. Bsw20308]|uniref:4'-phosphopantetheinyl transferase family protein n=1 Tax=Pseudoalteromonas sp. Bsw20308 TaxID=283699 RepID=UPI0002AA97BC|nr:4'-phosphopantetheinyl transferase superfamily protein [Pseudoalteromonas sp. Bsw20308]ALQ07159.1 hypothetical protein D172_003255 [Pseudoalteromonas sp. Bsw20308]
MNYLLSTSTFESSSEESYEFFKIKSIYSMRSNIFLIEGEFDSNFYSPALFDYYGVNLPVTIKKSVYKRQAEFLAGRIAAQHALLKLKYIGNNQVNIGESRAPIWPMGTIGSISHTNERVFCIVGKTENIFGVGLDVEDHIPNDMLDIVKDQVVDESEFNLLLALETPVNIALAIAFSAKESLFKAVYSSVNEFFGFDIAKIKVLNILKNQLILTLNEKFAEKHNIKKNYNILFYYDKQIVKTLVVCDNKIRIGKDL